MDLLAYGSTPAVGSSRMTIRDPAVNATAIDSFRFMPPVRQSPKQRPVSPNYFDLSKVGNYGQ